MEKKSYNIKALQGYDYDDRQHAADMNISVPENILYTPAYNDYVLNEIRNRNIEQLTKIEHPNYGRTLTLEEATKEADELYSAAKQNIKEIIDFNK